MGSMTVLATKGWEDYALLDSGEGKRLERFGKYTLVRPDPQCIWQPHLSAVEWEKADAIYIYERQEWERALGAKDTSTREVGDAV